MNNPVKADEYGVLYVPPAPPDPMPMYAAGVGLAAAAGVMLYAATRRRKNKSTQHADTTALSYDKYMRNGFRE